MVVAVIVIAVFIRQRSFIRVEKTAAIPLFSDHKMFLNECVLSPSTIVKKNDQRVEIVEEIPAKSLAEEKQHITFDDEVNVMEAAEYGEQAEEQQHTAEETSVEADHAAAEEEPEDPNFTPMTLDAYTGDSTEQA